jgi:CubicO group peptidase (beta-lactamase class C family)
MGDAQLRSHVECQAGQDMELRSYIENIDSALSTAGVTGASFAYWDGTRLHRAVTGVRNSVTGDPLTLDTVMHIGSITKLMNTVLLLQLVEEGRVSLEDPVSKHLPELRLKDARSLERITCAMLLNHTSGIDGDMLPDHGPDRERIEDAIARCAALDQVHSPGEVASYCNIGTVIAGYLAQKLRAQSWYTLVKTRIYQPTGMQLALADLTDLPRFRHCIGDVTDPVTGGLSQTTRAFLPLSFAPAGATPMMTAADLVTFGRTLANGGVAPNGTRILSRELSRRMTEPTAELVMPAMKVGLGWMLSGAGVLTHGGSVAGAAARLSVHLPSGSVAALLINCDRKYAITTLLDPIVESWTGKRLRPQDAPSPVDALEAKACAGVYESGLMRAEVASAGNSLTLRMSWKVHVLDNSPTLESAHAVSLRPLGNQTFEVSAMLPGFPNTQVRFVPSGSDPRMRFLATDGRLLPRTM